VTWPEYIAKFTETNPEIPVRLICKYSTQPKPASIPQMALPNQDQTFYPNPYPCQNPNQIAQTPTNPISDTESWIHKLNKTLDEVNINQLPASGSQNTQQHGRAPTRQSFLIPADENEHQITRGL
jgi:hypothetical protein